VIVVGLMLMMVGVVVVVVFGVVFVVVVGLVVAPSLIVLVHPVSFARVVVSPKSMVNLF